MKTVILSLTLLALAAPAFAGEWETISPRPSGESQGELQVGDHVTCKFKGRITGHGTVVAILNEKQFLFQGDNKYLDPYGTDKASCKKDD